MELIIITILLCASLFYNMKQYKCIKDCDCKNNPKRPIKKGTSTNIKSEDPSKQSKGQDV